MPSCLCTLPAPRDASQPPTLAELRNRVEALIPHLRLRDPHRPVALRLEVGGLRRSVSTDEDVRELFAQRPETAGSGEELKVEVSDVGQALSTDWDRTRRPSAESSVGSLPDWCESRSQSHPSACGPDWRLATAAQQRGQRALVLGPEWLIVGYKVVAKVGQSYFSIWAGQGTEYHLDLTVKDQALPNRAGGIYISDSPWSAARQFIPPNPGLASAQRAVLRCACEGPFIERAGGKVQCSQMTPLEEVPVPEEDKNSAPDGVWRRFYARGAREQPVRSTGEQVVPLDSMGRMDTMLFWDVIGYMVAAVVDGGYAGVWAGDANVYELGVSVSSEARHHCRGGFWVSRTAHAAAAQLLKVAARPSAPPDLAGRMVVLRCACGGPFVIYPGKIACSRVTPLGEVPAVCISPVPGAECVPRPDGMTEYTKSGAFTRLPPRARPGSAPAVRPVRKPSRPAPVRRRPCRGHPVSCCAA